MPDPLSDEAFYDFCDGKTRLQCWQECARRAAVLIGQIKHLNLGPEFKGSTVWGLIKCDWWNKGVVEGIKQGVALEKKQTEAANDENHRLRDALEKISELPPLVPDVDPFIQTCHNYGATIEIARAALGDT